MPEVQPTTTQQKSSTINETVTQSNTQELAQLVKQLEKLNGHLSRKSSLRFLFAAALLQGLGYLFGATLIASLVAAILVRFVSTLNFPALINESLNGIALPSAQRVELDRYPLQFR